MNYKEKITDTEKKSPPKGPLIFRILVLSFFVILGSVSILGLILPDKEFSENENRVLASRPVITVQGIYDGSFMKKAEVYLTDHFPFRDTAIRIKSYTERILGKSKENGAYFGNDGYLFDTPSEPDKEKLTALLSSINGFARENDRFDMCFALIPNSTYIYGDKLPDNVEFKNQKAQIEKFYSLLSEKFHTVDTVAALTEASREHQVFYRTDHHWTTRGAFSVFLRIADKLEIDASAEDYEFRTVSDSFRGTLSSKVSSCRSQDIIEICFPKDGGTDFFIDFGTDREKSASFFFPDKLDTKNQYEVFLGGNYGKLTITTSLTNDRKLLVIKDSYANCLLPLLTPYFAKITVLDPRYMTQSVDSILEEDEYTDALFLYNVNTLLLDTSVKDVM